MAIGKRFYKPNDQYPCRYPYFSMDSSKKGVIATVSNQPTISRHPSISGQPQELYLAQPLSRLQQPIQISTIPPRAVVGPARHPDPPKQYQIIPLNTDDD